MQGGRIQVVQRRSLTHAVFRLSTKQSLISSYRTWLSWQKCSISTSDSTLRCHLPSWPSLKCLQSEKDSKSLKERASLAAHTEASPRFPRLPALIHHFQVVPPTSAHPAPRSHFLLWSLGLLFLHDLQDSLFTLFASQKRLLEAVQKATCNIAPSCQVRKTYLCNTYKKLF